MTRKLTESKAMRTTGIGPCLHHWRFAIYLVAVVSIGPMAAKAAQKTFPNPEAAAEALRAATGKFDEPALRELFGPDYDRVKSADTAQLRENMGRFHRAMIEYLAFDRDGTDRVVLVIGAEAWPFPVPLVKEADGAWRFDSAAGAEEILNRRIGLNELKAIESLSAYVNAQRQYASKSRGAGPLRAFARRIQSSPGKKDGLYWKAAPGEEESPFGPLIAEAATRKAGAPYYGYHYRILTGQGPQAPGGAYSYIINGNMVAGFAMIAFPAAYGNTGIMSFIVNHYGDVYQRDFGADTAAQAAAIRTYNPDENWTPVIRERR
jgi:hypothetical protein